MSKDWDWGARFPRSNMDIMIAYMSAAVWQCGQTRVQASSFEFYQRTAIMIIMMIVLQVVQNLEGDIIEVDSVRDRLRYVPTGSFLGVR
jgi:hypothetical protein